MSKQAEVTQKSFVQLLILETILLIQTLPLIYAHSMSLHFEIRDVLREGLKWVCWGLRLLIEAKEAAFV